MRALDTKALRELAIHRGQFLAIGLVVACGVTSYVTMLSCYESLERSRAEYYDRYRLADVFVHLQRAPESAADPVSSLPGVGVVETRVVVEVSLQVAGFQEPVSGRIVSLPDSGEPVLNRLHLLAGRLPEPGSDREVALGESLATAHGIRPGDSIGAILHGRWRRLRVTGIAISPEYVYEIGGATMVFPDPERFGVLWMSRRALAAAFDMEGAFNDLSLSLVAGAEPESVIAELDRRFDAYGGVGAHAREDLVSDRFLANEILQLEAFGRVMPLVFLGVAAFLLHLVFGRMIQAQRDQIGILKAFGYGDATIAAHYLKTLLGVVVLGGAVGTAAGIALGLRFTRLYTEFFHFPVLAYAWDPSIWFTAIAASGAASAIGAFGAIRRAALLPPAEAMRAEPPAVFRRTLLERLGLAGFFRPATRIFLRNIERKPVPSILAIVGIGLAVGLLVVGRFFVDSALRLGELQFQHLQREDVSVALVEPRAIGVRHELASLPGVQAVEPYRSAAIRLRSENRTYRTAILGLEPDAELRRVVDKDLRAMPLPPRGVVLTAQLGEILGLEVGDRVRIEVLEGRRPAVEVEVVGLVEDLIGASAYMDLAALNRLLREGPIVSGAFLRVDPERQAEFAEELRDVPGVRGSAWRASAEESFQETLARSMGYFTGAMIAFACIIAFAVVYNGARISLSERGRELATLRVLGFTRGEVAHVLLGEQALLTLAGIPVGFLFGYGLAVFLVRRLATDLFRMPLVIHSNSYLFAAGIVILASLLSGLVVRRRIHHLDLVGVIKSSE